MQLPLLLVQSTGRPVAAPPDLHCLLTRARTAGSPAPDRSLPGASWRPARPGAGPRRRAPRHDRQAHLARHSPRSAADRTGSGQRPNRRHPSRGGRCRQCQLRAVASGLEYRMLSAGRRPTRSVGTLMNARLGALGSVHPVESAFRAMCCSPAAPRSSMARVATRLSRARVTAGTLP
jgi:hypothetical protein